MGRLIDANELIEVVKGSEELLDFQKDELIACVDACDTAYDVEKVVEQLKDASMGTSGVAIITLPTIIEIVRKGGVE